MRLLNFKNLMSPLRVTALVAACGFIMSCTKGGGISSSGGASSVNGAITLSTTYPTSAGATWTPITLASRFFIKGLDLTVVGVCSRGIQTIKVNEGGADYPETATCLDDGSFTFAKTYTAGAGEGNKTLHFTAYDSTGLIITAATASEDVRIDATAPTVPAITLPLATNPYSYPGASNQYTITGTVVVPDTDHITGPGGITITPDASTGVWSYDATLTEGAQIDFTFYSWDLAGNQSAGTTQTIIWSPSVILFAAGPQSGGLVNDTSGATFTMDATQAAMPGQNTDVFSNFSLKAGFNFIINTVRGL